MIFFLILLLQGWNFTAMLHETFLLKKICGIEYNRLEIYRNIGHFRFLLDNLRKDVKFVNWYRQCKKYFKANISTYKSVSIGLYIEWGLFCLKLFLTPLVVNWKYPKFGRKLTTRGPNGVDIQNSGWKRSMKLKLCILHTRGLHLWIFRKIGRPPVQVCFSLSSRRSNY